MRVILFAQVTGFYLSTLKLSDAVKPVVVYRDACVLDCNGAARTSGISADMPLAEAKAILAGRGSFIEWSADVFTQATEGWLNVCADFADSIEPRLQHEAFIDLSGHPDPSDIARRLCSAIESHTGLPGRYGLACSKWVARLAALCESEADPLTSPAVFVSPFPTRSLPIDSGAAKRLEILGYRSIGEVATIPWQTLHDQFGDEAYLIKEASRGRGDQFVSPDYPPNQASSRFAFESAPDTTETLYCGLCMLSKDLGEKLLKRELYGEDVAVTLEHEDGSTSTFGRRFAKPISSPGSLWGCLRLLFEKPPEKPVIVVRVRITKLRPVGRVQRDISGLTARGERDRSAVAAICHVQAAFGTGSVVLGADIRLPRYKEVRRLWGKANGWTSWH